MVNEADADLALAFIDDVRAQVHQIIAADSRPLVGGEPNKVMRVPLIVRSLVIVHSKLAERPPDECRICRGQTASSI